MLFEPDRHQPLAVTPWDPARASEAITRIVRATRAACTPQGLWPPHPDDLAADDDPSRPFTPLYFGAIGVHWALQALAARGHADAAAPPPDFDALRMHQRAWLRADGSDDDASWLMGELPLELMQWDLTRDAALEDRIAAAIDGLSDHPARELMWGAPGGLLAARLMHERSGGMPRWAALYRRLAAALEAQLEWSDAHGCHFWTQDLYGRRSRYLDAVHGFVATASVLVRGRTLLAPADTQRWLDRIATTVRATATHDGGLVNWRAELDEPADRPPKWLMQFCHGAPGFVICLADWPDAGLDDLLAAAGEAVWAAGPLAKGAGLCHGTAGNGHAFLALFRRSGDPRWLARARAFAMHAIAQSEADAARHGGLRHSLWTGDTGLALYLDDCLRDDGGPGFPTLDFFF